MVSVERLWCAAGYPLPLQPRVLDLVAVNQGKAEVLRPDGEFLLLDLKVSQYCSWLDKALAKPPRWWWQHGFHQRLIQEIIQAIPGTKALRNGKLQKVPGMSANTVVKIVVRDTEVLVLNNRKAVTLAFDAGTFDGKQDLQWILDVLLQELTPQQEEQEDLQVTGGPPRRKKGRTSKEPQKLEDLIATTRQILKRHVKAKTVYFLRSCCWEVRGRDGQKKRFWVPEYDNKRLLLESNVDDAEAWQILLCRFAECEAAAIAYLDSLSASSSPPGPGAGSEDREGTGGPRSDLEGAEDTDVEPPSEG